MTEPITTIESFFVFTRNGQTIFSGTDVTAETFVEHFGLHLDSNGEVLTQRRQKDTFTFFGQWEDYKFEVEPGEPSMPVNVNFLITYRRRDIIEILKFGQFHKVQGGGLVTEMSTINNPNFYMRVEITTVISIT